MTDLLVKTWKQGAIGQVRVGKTWGLSLFLPHHHLGDLWSECQEWKYTNRYFLIIYSQVYIPETATFHYFQLHWKQYLQKLTPSLILPVSKYNASQQVQRSEHHQRSYQQIQAAHVRTVPKWGLKFVCITYLRLCTASRSQRKAASHAQQEHFCAGSWVLMLRTLDLRLAQHNFASAARSRNLVETGTAPVDVQITPLTACNKSIVWAGAIECKCTSHPRRNNFPTF